MSAGEESRRPHPGRRDEERRAGSADLSRCGRSVSGGTPVCCRHDVRELVRRGLSESDGRYKALLGLFGMPAGDYRRFMNFLAAHDFGVEFREFRPTQHAPKESSGAAAATSSMSSRRVVSMKDARANKRAVEFPTGASSTAASCA